MLDPDGFRMGVSPCCFEILAFGSWLEFRDQASQPLPYLLCWTQYLHILVASKIQLVSVHSDGFLSYEMSWLAV